MKIKLSEIRAYKPRPSHLLSVNDAMLARIRDYVTNKHNSQLRKDGRPYIGHITRVSQKAGSIAQSVGAQPLVCTATGYLHDTIEDQRVHFEEIARVANGEIACLVALLSDDKRLPYLQRQLEYIKQLGADDVPITVHIVKLADLIDNADDALINVRSEAPTISVMERWSQTARKVADALHGVQNINEFKELLTTLDAIDVQISQFCGQS